MAEAPSVPKSQSQVSMVPLETLEESVKTISRFKQISSAPKLAAGKGFTVIVTVSGCTCEQVVELESCILIKTYINVPAVSVETAISTLFPLVVFIV